MGHFSAFFGLFIGAFGSITAAVKSHRTVQAGNVAMVFFFGRPAWSGRQIEPGKIWIPFWYKLKLCYVEDSNTDDGGEVTVERACGGQAYANATLTYQILRRDGVIKALTGSENYGSQITSFFLGVVADVVAKTPSLLDRETIVREIHMAVAVNPQLIAYGIKPISVTVKTCAQTQASSIAGRIDLRALFAPSSGDNVLQFPSQDHGSSSISAS
jgi:hypothetical protein